MAMNDHLNPQGLTPGVGPYFDPSKPSAKQKYARSQFTADTQKSNRADSEKKWQAKQSAKYDAIKAAAKPRDPGAIPGLPDSSTNNSLTRLQAKYAAENTPVKKPGLFSRIHRAVNLRQFGKRK